MKTNRVDNFWKSPQPNFLNRIAMYDQVFPEIEDLLNIDFEVDEEGPKNRKQKCLACTPEKFEILKVSYGSTPFTVTFSKIRCYFCLPDY